MKLLHNDKNLFRDVIETVSQHTGQNIKIVEKDYYVTMILKNLTLRIPELVFKGGTSLSKCHHVINRFSEDVDLSTDIPVPQKRRKEIKNIIRSVVQDLGLEIVNIEDTRSRRDYNKYKIAFGSVVKEDLDIVNENVVLEMTYISTALPNEKLPVENIIGDFLNEKQHMFYEEYGLIPFEMKVQSLERTFIDKIFALCDYSMREE
ncbi:MAG: nucleotidyl transferase AbiEii/AbiGii toxin family protein, partial [Phascolarctobacterium sp.]|nr:nucleotidyl transferase AbiEii/AbiGii toxin family protein [Candidatus Phascolarctobacterium caballi]